MDPSRTNTNQVKHNKMIKEQLENLGIDALIEIVLTSDRTANNWEEIADLRQKEIEFLQAKIKTLNEIALTSDRTANNWEEIAGIRENEIDRLEAKIITLNEIEHDQLIKISKLRSELQKIASNLEISQRFTKNVISNSY